MKREEERDSRERERERRLSLSISAQTTGETLHWPPSVCHTQTSGICGHAYTIIFFTPPFVPKELR